MLLAGLQSKITEDGKIECRQCKSYKSPFEPYLEYSKLGGDPLLYRYCSTCRASAKPCTGSKHEVDYQTYPHIKSYVLSVAGVPKISESQKGPEPMNFFQMQIDKMIVDDQSKGYNPNGIISIPDKNLLVACSKDGRVTVWSLGDEVEPVTDFNVGKAIKCVKYFTTGSGKSILAIGAGAGINIYEFEENKPELKRTLDHTADVKCFEYVVANESAEATEDGKLVSVSADNILREWDIASPRCCSDRSLKENSILEPPSRIVHLKEKGLLALNSTNEIALIKLDEKSFSKKISCPESGISMCYLPSRNKIIVRADRRSFAQLDIANNFKRNVPKGSLMFEPYVPETTYIANQDESQVISNDMKDFLVASDFTKEALSKSFGHLLLKISAIVPIPNQNRLILGDDTSGAILILRTNMESTPKAKRSHAIKTIEKASVIEEVQKPYQSSLFSNKPTQTGTEKLFQNLKSQDSIQIETENVGAGVEELPKNVEIEESNKEPQENKPIIHMETETVTEIEIETGTGEVLQLSETTLNAEPLKPEEDKSAQIETETPIEVAEPIKEAAKPESSEKVELIKEPAKPQGSLFSGQSESLFKKEPAKPQSLEKIELVKEPAKPQGSLFSSQPESLFKKEPAKPQGSLFTGNAGTKPTTIGSGGLFGSSSGKVGENGLLGKLAYSGGCARLFSNTNNSSSLGGGLFSSSGTGGGGLFSGSLFGSGTGTGTGTGGGGLFAKSSHSSLFGTKTGTGGGLFSGIGTGGTGGSLFSSGPSLFSKPAPGGGLFSGLTTGTVGGGLFGNSKRGKNLSKPQTSGSTAKKVSASKKTAKSSLNKKALASASKKKVEKVKAKTSRSAKPISKNQKVKEAKTRAVKAVAKKASPKKKTVEEDEKLSNGALQFTRIRDDLKISKSKKKKKEEKEEPVWVVLPEDEKEEEGGSKVKVQKTKSPKKQRNEEIHIGRSESPEKPKRERSKSPKKPKSEEIKRGRSKSPKAEKGKKEKQKSEEKEKDRSRSRSKSQNVSSKKSIHETIKGAKELVKGIRKKLNAKKKQEK